ncbi:hypothetical protein FQA47_005811 [Oryzias melastigma]|uniref:Pyrin domain-containing protein n=1 Tax=Oryzias melastigma TaxID=30732 RepID=A0A834FTQ3_ORYME|nr:hypothetical protein FQA47_005811 [Oryzias melastigma]
MCNCCARKFLTCTDMSRISEEWRQTMTKIFELLREDQYKKMLESLKYPSKERKTAKFRKELPQKIIESYGLEGSIYQVNKAMKEIPRNDPAVQELLKPFVDKLRNEQEKMQKRKKRKLEDDLEAGGRMLLQNSAAGSNKIQMVADSSGKNKEPGKKRKVEADPKTGGRMLQQNSAAGSEKKQVVLDSLGKNKEPDMSRISEEWRQTMTRIFELLTEDQYKKMLESLKYSSTTRKTAKFRNELPQKIIESYGLEGSIYQVNKAMTEIPRNDPAVQGLLKPFVDKLRNEQEKMQKSKFS